MKIQYKSQPLDATSNKRYLCFRIVPSELSWWKRIFKNPWLYVYTAYSIVFSNDRSVNDCLCFIFLLKDEKEIYYIYYN